MKCEICKSKKSKTQNKSIFTNPNLCKEHFIEYFENKVENTIKKYSLLSKNEKIVVATSGGKDSTVLLYLLKKFGYNVTALAIDEGIFGYRNKTLDNLQTFCSQYKIKLKIVSFNKEFGKSLDSMLKLTDAIPCSVCGAFRRQLLNKYARSYDKIATGHNLDDESQSILMNLAKNNLEIASRLGPITGLEVENNPSKNQKKSKTKSNILFVPRVKPLYFCYEKEVLAYSYLMQFEIDYVQCPHVVESFRAKIRDMLNEIESEKPGSKLKLVENFIFHLPKLKKHFSSLVKSNPSFAARPCRICNEPTDGEICRACIYLEKLGLVKNSSSKFKTLKDKSLNNQFLNINVK